MEFSVGVVLPAAGCGERMGLPVPKQFCKILGRPLISYTIEAFERIPWINDIIVVTNAAKMVEMENILRSYNHSSRVHITEGASVRHRSIYNGLLELQRVAGGPPKVVVIHDAVRPFVDEETVNKVAVAAEDNGSSGAIRPLISTVIATDSNGFLDQSLDRTKYRASEMPQAFKYDVIKKAYDRVGRPTFFTSDPNLKLCHFDSKTKNKQYFNQFCYATLNNFNLFQCTDYDFDYGTECLHLVDKYVGIKAKLIEGPDNLWKVTLRKDLYAAEGMFLEEDRRVQLHSLSQTLEISLLMTQELAKFDFKVSNDKVPGDAEKPSHHIKYLEGASQWNESLLMQLLPASCIVAMVKSTEPKTDFAHVYEKLTSVSKNCPRCTINAVLFQESSDLQSVCELVVSLIQKRNINLTGQVLLR